MILKNTMLRITVASAAVLSLFGCEHDEETIGAGVIGEPNFNARLYENAQITTTNNPLEAVQTNNLPVNLLGVYNHEVYGLNTASLLTQVSLPTQDPQFGDNPVLDSVVLSIPYFSTAGETNEQGRTSYELDSIYGNSPIRLSIEESNFFLNNYDPETNFETAQVYYSDMQETIENNLTGNVLFESEAFVPSSEEVVVYDGPTADERDTLYLSPQMRLHLPVQFFQDKILDKEGDIELSGNNNFRNFLRGLYIKAQDRNGSGQMMLLNLEDEDAGITLYYTTESEDSEEGVQNSYTLDFGPNEVNVFEQTLPPFEEGNLYLKGGAGSMAIVELFSGTDSDEDGVSDELEDLRANEWLINEANLVFHVNQDALGDDDEPRHVYLYNLDQNRLLGDYVLDNQQGENQMSSVTNYNHLVPLEEDGEGNGLTYKIRITSHIASILNNGADNVRLGLAVSQNINEISNSAVKESENNDVERVPVSSVISPEGTVLYGVDAADDEKRPKLRIYYTESKE